MSRQPTAKAGKKLGRYRIERELGRGGMGVVYVAEDENTGRLVALKTTSVAGLGGGERSRNQRRQRFVREVQALTNVNHDNVVHVFDAGEADDPDLGWLLFYSMEYVEGETLAQLVQRRGPLDPGAAAAVCMQVAAGLGAAHRAAQPIVHRDVKPANIFISHDGRALIGDFGICKIEGSTQITRRDQLVGTPNYLAPEQILGDAVGPPTDVFALGALFYVITMNRPLRSHVDAASLLASAQGNEPRERMLSERHVPEGLRKVIARCLERDPKKRWADGVHLADALAEHATRIPPLRDDTMMDPTKEPTSTSDRSSPFASLQSAPSGDVMELPEAADPMDVEAAARALLGEVARREGGKPKEEEKPLPVAKTESTVMFNLRAMEEQQKQKPLPVAKTESTVVFKMRGDDKTDKLPPSPSPPGASSRLDDTQIATGRDDTSGGDETSDRLQPPVRTLNPTTEDNTSRPSIKLPIAQIMEVVVRVPRVARLALTGALGMIMGLVVVAILAPEARSTTPPPVVAERPLLPHKRPAICPDSGKVGNTDRAQKLYDEARAGLNAGAQLSEVRRKVEESLRENPFSAEGYYLYGQVLRDPKDAELARQAYACTCFVSSGSPECREVKNKKLAQ